MVTKKALQREIEFLRESLGKRCHEIRKLRRREKSLMAKLETYEDAYHSAQEFLCQASHALTSAYTKKIAAAGDGNNGADD